MKERLAIFATPRSFRVPSSFSRTAPNGSGLLSQPRPFTLPDRFAAARCTHVFSDGLPSMPDADIRGMLLDGTGALKGFIGLAPWADAAATIVMLGLPTMAGSLSPESARAWGAGGGLVLRLPLSGTRPWLDGDALFVRTGLPGHFAFAAGGGLSFPLGEKRSFWLGPFVRYLQIVGYDSGGDSKSLIVGLSLEATASFSAAR